MLLIRSKASLWHSPAVVWRTKGCVRTPHSPRREDRKFSTTMGARHTQRGNFILLPTSYFMS
jgi:hypothetical protein